MYAKTAILTFFLFFSPLKKKYLYLYFHIIHAAVSEFWLKSLQTAIVAFHRHIKGKTKKQLMLHKNSTYSKALDTLLAASPLLAAAFLCPQPSWKINIASSKSFRSVGNVAWRAAGVSGTWGCDASIRQAPTGAVEHWRGGGVLIPRCDLWYALAWCDARTHTHTHTHIHIHTHTHTHTHTHRHAFHQNLSYRHNSNVTHSPEIPAM